MPSTREINQLLAKVDKDWLSKRMDERHLLNTVMDRSINKPVLQYVDTKIKGENPKSLHHHRSPKNGRVVIIRRAYEPANPRRTN